MGVAVTGIGVISAIGSNVSENLQSLLEEKSGIGPVFLPVPDRELLAGAVRRSDGELRALSGLLPEDASRTSLLGVAAALEAWGSNRHTTKLRTGFISATSVGGMDRTERFYKDLLAGKDPDYRVLWRHDSGDTTGQIARALGFSGYVNTLSTACSSGANAIMLGARLLLQGKLDRVLVGGTDALTGFTVNGFGALMIYDQEWCRPFDDTRNGLNLGEGAAYLLLERPESLEVTGNAALCGLAGWCNAADAYHQTASSPEGTGATISIEGALRMSGAAASSIGYVNAHGTGTKNNDLSESVALKNVFGGHVPDFSSTKAYTGHTLAAAGAIEAVYAVLAIRHGLVFPNLNFRTPIPETGLVPRTTVVKKEIDAVLSNSFGFGGNNSSLVFRRHPF